MDFQRIQQFPDNEQIALNVPLKPYDGAELLKVILIDSVVPGRIVKMPISGGTVLTGKNGSGKTSFLQLISFFYGESPNKIVSSSQKLSFVQYYLPNTTSYLVFEYQRSAESKRCVAVYSDRSGERPIYRFIRQGFDRRMFIAEEAQSFIPAADLVKHLKKNGYLCEEKQIETVQDFRGIIQGVQTHSSDRQYQRYLHELTKDYSLAITHPLRQIDKVVNGMFSRTTDFDDLQNMVVACVAEENSSLHIDVDRNKFEQWPRDYRSFIAVEKEEPRYQKATELNNELISVEESLGQIKGKLRSLVKHSQVDATRTEQDRKRHEATLTTARDQMYKDKGALFETRDTNKNDAESREKTVKALENRLGDYERRDVNSAIKAINESEITYQKREDRKQKLEAIDKGHQAIVTYCELQKAVYKDRLVENMADIDRKMDQARFRAETQIAEIERDYKEKENQYIEADEQKLVILRSDLSELENKQGQSQYAYNHPTISQVLIHGKEAKNKNIIAAKNNTAKAKDVLDGNCSARWY